MRFSELLAEVDRLSDEERAQLTRRLRARELAADPARTADLAARLDRTLAGKDSVDEEQLRARLGHRGTA